MNNLSNGLQIFNNPQFGNIRTLEIESVPYFVGNDVAKVLGYAYPKDAIRDNVDEEDKQLVQLSDFQQGEQTPPPHMKSSKIMIINESGVYSLVFGSKLPTAKDFKHWVTKDVLPSIRKTGGYIIEKEGDTDDDILNRALIIAQNRIKEREQRIALLEDQNRLSKEQLQIAAPKVEYFDAVLQSTNTYTATQIAKEFGFSAETLNKKLKEKGVQYKQNGQWLLTYKYQDKGYTKSKTVPYPKADGTQGSSMQTVWTEKGRLFIHDIFKAN